MKKYLLETAARFLAPPLYYSQLHHLTRPAFSGLGHILMLHRVVPESKSQRIHNHKSLEITPEYLEQLIMFFKKRNYHFCSLNDLDSITANTNNLKKFVIFTLDDGYVDNYEFAWPVFKKHNIPFTIYVATGLPDGTAILWWYLLEDLIVKIKQLDFNFESKAYKLANESIRQKESNFNLIRSLLTAAMDGNRADRIKEFFEQFEIPVYETTKAMSLSWSQIAELSNDPLVTIGAHTVNHFPLRVLSDSESRFEIIESGKRIESQIKKSVEHFCYPIGSYGPREVSILNGSVYKTATTIQMANLMAENLRHPFTLPRIMINALTTEKVLTLQVNGLLPAIRNKFRKVVF